MANGDVIRALWSITNERDGIHISFVPGYITDAQKRELMAQIGEFLAYVEDQDGGWDELENSSIEKPPIETIDLEEITDR